MFINYLDFDKYAKEVGIYYNLRDKIGTNLGFALTLCYIFLINAFFIYYIIKVLLRSEIKVYDSTIYPKEIPSINITNNDLFYIAFGLEEPDSIYNFIDERIYTVKVDYFDNRRINNIWYEMESKHFAYGLRILGTK